MGCPVSVKLSICDCWPASHCPELLPLLAGTVVICMTKTVLPGIASSARATWLTT
jgi:hypothetical protein